jgi:predicted metal-dependent hydrolase
MEKLSKEDLMNLLVNAEKTKKPRKKPDLDEEKKLAMLDRLATMRETVKQNREAKRKAVDLPMKEKEIDEVFEKKYGTKFEKMAELLTDLNENTKEVVKMKKEKAAKREMKEKETEVKMEVKEPLAKAASAPATPQPIVPMAAPVRSAFPVQNNPVNPNIHRKGTTRW